MTFLILRKQLLFLLILLGVSGFFTLTALFSINLIGERYFFDKLYYQKSAAYGYAPKMSSLVATQNNPSSVEHRITDLRAVVNAAQGSTKAPQLHLAQNTYKVVLIGDSIVYGEGIKEHERFGALLSAQLNEIRPTQVFVLAQPNDNLLDNYAKFMLAEKYIHPDLYVFGIVPNDLLFDDTNTFPGEQQIYEQLRQVCPQQEYRVLLSSTMDWSYLIQNVYSNTFVEGSANECYLRTLASWITAQNTRVLSLPFDDNPLPSQLPKDVEEFRKQEASQIATYAAAFRDAGIKVLLPHKLHGFAYWPVSSHEGHPSARTHTFYATLLFNEITQNSKWSFHQ